MPGPDRQDNLNLIRKFFEALNQNRPEILHALVHENVVLHGTPGAKGIEAYFQVMERVRVAFPDQQFTLHDVIADGDRVAVRWTMDATHDGVLAGIPATGKRVQQRANVIYRFEDGRIGEIWAQMDQVGMLCQLGQTTLPAVPVAAQR